MWRSTLPIFVTIWPSRPSKTAFKAQPIRLIPRRKSQPVRLLKFDHVTAYCIGPNLSDFYKTNPGRTALVWSYNVCQLSALRERERSTCKVYASRLTLHERDQPVKPVFAPVYASRFTLHASRFALCASRFTRDRKRSTCKASLRFAPVYASRLRTYAPLSTSEKTIFPLT